MAASLLIGIIKEGKNPPDMRVPLTPAQCQEVQQQYPEIKIVVQESDVRVFSDEEYTAAGIEVVANVAHAHVLIGVKEVPTHLLVPNKKYFFFSHTTKEQPYNRGLLQALLAKNITMIDYEGLTNNNGQRVIGFGYYAGIVGAYNGLMAWGKRFNSFELPSALTLKGLQDMQQILEQISLPAMKIVVTGGGRVAHGVVDIMKMAGIKRVTPDAFLNISDPTEAVYTQLGVTDYNKRKDGAPASTADFYKNFRDYESNFIRFAHTADMYISGHFYAEHSPFLFTREDAKHPAFNLKVVADISCDIDGPVACTLRPSTIKDPLYGYHPETESEVDFNAPGAITVMAVDNLPCELPSAASQGFGKEFIANVLPQLLNNDAEGMLKRATICENGALTQRYSYLENYVNGK